MLDMLTPYMTAIKVGAIVLILGAVFYAGWTVESWRAAKEIDALNLSIETQKTAAEKTLADKTEQVLTLERQNEAATAELEKANALRAAKIQDDFTRNRADIDRLGGLFDPAGTGGRGQGGNGTLSASPGTSLDPASTGAGCRLSITVSDAVLDLFRQADDAAAYAQAGHDYAAQIMAIRGAK